MRNVNLEENELTITAIFQQHTKEETIQTLKEALEVLEQEESDPENDEMIEIINSTVGKLQQIEDKYYYSLDLNYYLNNLEDDAYEAYSICSLPSRSADSRKSTVASAISRGKTAECVDYCRKLPINLDS